MLEVANLKKSFGGIHALTGVSLTARPGRDCRRNRHDLWRHAGGSDHRLSDLRAIADECAGDRHEFFLSA